ncbi:MAG: dihydroorotase, partial [Rubritepida sp.]|nr:dihydroorotase [Rubritepida sp.]
MHYDLILRNGLAVLPWGIERLDIGVRAGRIAAMGDLRRAGIAPGGGAIDCSHPHIPPRI